MHGRVFHRLGAGDDLGVVELPESAPVGGLICWENRPANPLSPGVEIQRAIGGSLHYCL